VLRKSLDAPPAFCPRERRSTNSRGMRRATSGEGALQAARKFALEDQRARDASDSARVSGSSSVVKGPQESLRAPAISSSANPIPSSTWLCEYDWDVQAEPFEMAAPSCSASRAASASTPGIERLSVVGIEHSGRPWTFAPSAANASSSEFLITLAAVWRWLRSFRPSSAASARPDQGTGGTGCVPGRRPFSCPPPNMSGVSGGRLHLRFRVIRAPTPFGA
jgi:hypothetical protein